MKWRLDIKDSYTVGGNTVTRTHPIAIPYTDGDRVDIIGESGKYYYGVSVKQFRKEKKDSIAIVITINKGEITISSK